MKLWKTLLAAGIIIAATGGALALMFKPDNAASTVTQSEPIWDARTTTVTLGDYRPQIKLIGQVEPVRDLNELAQLSAQVTAVYFKSGMRVEAGELIVQLDDFDAQMQLQQTQADLADLNARLQLQASQQKLDKEALEVEKANLVLLQDRLRKQKSISQTQQAIDDLEQQIQRQQFAVLQREAAIQNHPANEKQLAIARQKLELARRVAERNQAHTKVTAPFSGKLAQVFVKEGQRINPGQALFRLYSEDEMAVLVQLPTALLSEKDQLSGIAFEQKRMSDVQYDRSEAQIISGQSGFKAWFTLSQPQQWLPGDIAYLTLNLAPQRQTLKIPAAAVFQDRWVYSVDEEQRLTALEVSVLGSVGDGERSQLVVQTQTTTDEALRLLLTRLNNPTTGMKVYEQGVDPEPVNTDDEDPEGDAPDVEANDDEVSDEDA